MRRSPVAWTLRLVDYAEIEAHNADGLCAERTCDGTPTDFIVVEADRVGFPEDLEYESPAEFPHAALRMMHGGRVTLVVPLCREHRYELTESQLNARRRERGAGA